MTLSYGVVSNAIKLYKETGDYNDRIHPGRQRATTSAIDKYICSISLRDRRKTAVDIQRELHTYCNINISTMTVRRRLMQGGLFGRVARKKPLISERNRRRRLAWARQRRHWTVKEWEKVLWTDESKFNRMGSDGKVYVRRRSGEAYSPGCVLPTMKGGGGGVCVWASMTGAGTVAVRLINGIMKKEQYLNILQTTMLPTARRAFGRRPWIFMHDNDPKHTAHIVRGWLEKQRFQTMPWPAQSPDLNPIEHLWEDVDKIVRETKPESLGQLWMLIHESWQGIPRERCKKLVESMPRRCAAVIKARGNSTKY
jgi:hypothetical protein